MALKGTLKDFSIADIFQLIGQQQKSGSLYITNNDQIVHVMFDKGNVVIARFKQGNDTLMIGNMLLKAGLISEDQLQEAMENQQTTLRSLGDILLGMNFISAENLTEFVTLQVKEVLFRLFQWKNGLYEFVPEDFKYNRKVLQAHRSENLLLDGFRMMDEWPAIIKKIGSLDTIFKPLINTASLTLEKKEFSRKEVSIDEEIDMAFKEFDENEKAQAPEVTHNFSEEEKKVIVLVDGWRQAKDIAALSRLGTFDTCLTLASLLDKGAIMKMDISSPSKLDAAMVFKPTFLTKKKFFAKMISELAFVALLAFLAPSLIFYYSSNTMARKNFRPGFYFADGGKPLEKYFRNNRLDQIRVALERYRLEHDIYPENLKTLCADNLLPEKLIDESLYFRKTGDTYLLLL